MSVSYNNFIITISSLTKSKISYRLLLLLKSPYLCCLALRDKFKKSSSLLVKGVELFCEVAARAARAGADEQGRLVGTRSV